MLSTKNKHRKWMKYKNCKTDSNFQLYKVARNKVSSELRQSNYSYEKDIAFKIKDNNKLIWSYVRSKTKTKLSVSKLDKGDGELTQCDQEAADVLNDYIASVFEVEEDQELPTFNEQPCTGPSLKIVCLQLPTQVFKEWVGRSGISFFNLVGKLDCISYLSYVEK